jgi:hypothetical protein
MAGAPTGGLTIALGGDSTPSVESCPGFSVERLPTSGYNQLDCKPLQIESLKRRSIIKIDECTHLL